MRKEGIGYLPDMKIPRETVELLLRFFQEPKSMWQFSLFIEEHYGKKSESTVRLIQNTLTNYGLIEETEDFVFCITDVGKKWLANPSVLELTKIIDKQVVFISELLQQLKKQSSSAEELIINAKLHYDWDLHGSDISRRTQLLKSAGLIKMNRHKIYSITQEGVAFLDELISPELKKHENDIEKPSTDTQMEMSVERMKEAEKSKAKAASNKKSKQVVDLLLGKGTSQDAKMDQVAQYLLHKCEDITPLALQKALYYVQGFYFAFYGSFIFSEDCEAWVHGPVYRTMYARYKDYHFDPLQPEMQFDDSVFSASERMLLDSIIQNFCCYSGKTLERFTQREQPWKITRGNLTAKANSNKIIRKELIGEYFIAVKNKYSMLSEVEIGNYAKSMFEQI